MDSGAFTRDMLITFGGLAVGVVVITVLLVWFFRVMGRNNKAEVLMPNERATSYKAQCPSCGHVMEPGFVMLPKGIIWRGEKEKPSSMAPIWNAMPNTLNMGFSPAENAAWRCDKCRIVLVDHSRLVLRKKSAVM